MFIVSRTMSIVSTDELVSRIDYVTCKPTSFTLKLTDGSFKT